MKSVKVFIFGVVSALMLTSWSEVMYDWSSSGTYALGGEKMTVMPESGEVYWKLSGVKPGQPYTFVAAGSGASVSVVYTYKDDGDTWDDTLSTGEDDLKTSDQNRCIVTYDDWLMSYIVIEDPEDKEYKVSPMGYYLHVEGDEGARITVTSQAGAVEEPIPVGDVDNPKTLKPGTLPSTYTAKYVDGSYCFETPVVAGGKYLFVTTGGTEEDPVSLTFGAGEGDGYQLENVSAKAATSGNEAYLLTITKNGTLQYSVSGMGESFGLTSQYATEGTLGRVTVTTKGFSGKWFIKGVKTQYASGETVAVLGAQTITFQKVTGFATPADQRATPTDEKPDVEILGVYTDTFDPKDDTVTGATKISPTAKVAKVARTLFAEGMDKLDLYDHFAFTAKDGVYYNFGFADLAGDATMTVFRKGDALETVLAGPATEIAKFAPGRGDYIIRVAHENPDAPVDAQYTLQHASANVGAISFARTAVSAKKTAGQVALTVNRSAGEGKVRVRYGTVAGTAQPGVDYVAQQGELVWENGDRKAKTITVKLIPERFAEEALSRQFRVQLKTVDEDDFAADEYPATLAMGRAEAVVTVTETKARAATPVRAATTKTEVSPLEVGNYQGVLSEDGSALTNGFPALASVTFSAKAGAKRALSAKVSLAGKTYSFTADTWDADETDAASAVATLTQIRKSGKVAYTNELRVTVNRGWTTNDWSSADAEVVLTMNVPDARGTGVQEGISYKGTLFRDSAKIQAYLDAVTNAVGYYTVALVPNGVVAADGIPAGNGYLTLKIDTKGKAKVAGLLADGTTKPSYTSIVAVRDDGDTLLVPVFVARSPFCFGGTLKLVRGEDGAYVVDSSEMLLWNNDNATLTYDGEEGWRIELEPVGGYFNTVDNLQAHYLTHSFSVSADVEDISEEVLAKGYSFVAGVKADETVVSLVGNAFRTDKKNLVKDKDNNRLYDLGNSVNPCNVQVKLARATGLVTGSFSIWTENAEGAQKEISNVKHNGVLLLMRDSMASLDVDVLSAGFFTQKMTLSYEDANGRTKRRNYTASLPFNLLAVDQGDPDWWADDWGERPEISDEN